MANVSKLLYTTAADTCFLENLRTDDTGLKEARKKIRDHLRQEFTQASRSVFGRVIQPKFFTQGSHAYRTLNDPAWTPPQQKDLDDGCYLPLFFVRGARPSQAASMFFDFVDTALISLARQEGWQHVKKPTCVRLVVAPDAHVDVPLYAIPDAEFQLLQKRVATQAAQDAAKVKPDIWEALPSDAVLLAHRDEDWIVSDPRKIHAWFISAVELYGERLRRICRYLKAWRDHHRPHLDGASSVLLMACVWMVFEETRRAFLPDREDELLMSVAKRLPALLNGPVPNPACKEEDLNRLSREDREVVVEKANELRVRIEEVITNCSVQQRAVDLMTIVFGERLPDRPDLVSITEVAKVTILSYPRKEVPAPVVGRSQSG
ncbi:MAG: hypothetical protein E5X67_21330 [Mesorhizobium sp.]|uniref:CBASS cGAMP synthase n=1 Tax=Mesorhizobium sp. TaxID=1871066 RepID=UPI0012265AB6|nr:CBASS cGAMP synthase [Mesorhizobium sp.]TIP26208.1 MAG: hypothetical protein E5X67_21330 [Mesorhizobium sp.]